MPKQQKKVKNTSFIKKYVEKKREKERQRITERERWLQSIIDEIESDKETVEAGGLSENEGTRLEQYAKKHGYVEDCIPDSDTKLKGYRFKIIFKKTPLSELSRMLDIPQNNMTVIKVELTNMVQCEYCKTTFDLNQQPRCPHCGGKSSTSETKRR